MPGRQAGTAGQGNTEIVLATANESITCTEFNGRVIIRAPNVTITNSAVTTRGHNGSSGSGSIVVGGPGSPSAAAGGFSVTNIRFDDNSFSTFAAACVGKYGVWFDRPSWVPYQGGPTDGWHRQGNVVLETGEKIDGGDPHKPSGDLCR